MVNNRIKDYTKYAPYKLVWRLDFDSTLKSVCIISGEEKDPDNLTSAEKMEIESEYGYLKSMEALVDRWHFEEPLTEDMKKVLLSDNGRKSKWFDVVNEGYPNPDEQTYTYKIYFMLDNGTKIDLKWEGTDGVLSSDGFFQFDDNWIPMWTRQLEDGVVTKDYRNPTGGKKNE